MLPKKEKDGKKCRPCGENRLIEFFFKDGQTKLGEYTTKPRQPEWTEERRKAMSEKIKQIKEAKKNGSK